jgi:uncharacterized membrane protein
MEMIDTGMTRRRMLALTGAGAFSAALGPHLRVPRASAALADAYELIDIGITSPLQEYNLGFNDMNDNGVVVGNMYIDAEKNSPWIFQDGQMTRIRTGQYGARVSCINNNGVMGGRELLGWHNESQPFGRPVLWIDGEKEVLPYPEGLPGPAEEGRVFDLNSDGVAVGNVSIAGGTTFPVVWRNGVPQVLEMPSGESRGVANHINETGTIVGDVSGDDDFTGGAIWGPFGLQMLSFENPPGIDGIQTFGYYGLDNSDRILGGLYLENGSSIASYYDIASATIGFVGTEFNIGEADYVSCSGGANLFGGVTVVDDRSQAIVWNDGERIELKSLIRNTRGLRIAYLGKISPDGVMAGNAIDGDGALHAVQIVPA